MESKEKKSCENCEYGCLEIKRCLHGVVFEYKWGKKCKFWQPKDKGKIKI